MFHLLSVGRNDLQKTLVLQQPMTPDARVVRLSTFLHGDARCTRARTKSAEPPRSLFPGRVCCFIFLFCHCELPQKEDISLLERMQVFCMRQTTTFGAEEFVENWVMAAKRGHPLILAWQALFNGYWNSKSRHSGHDRDG